jgi:subtilisin family serine protease
MKPINNICNTLCLSLLLLASSGCGGSSSSASQEIVKDTVQEENEVENKTDNESETPSVSVKEEPYYKYAWHLEYSAEVENFGVSKEAHINVKEAWKTYQGKGIKIAVIDSRYDVNHEDLKANIVATFHANNKDSDVIDIGTEGTHGTTVAGFIASPLNDKGSVGVAYNASLILITEEFGDDADTIAAFEYAKAQGAKIISNRWGPEPVSEAVAAEIQSLHDAGLVILFASGNDGKSLDDNGIDDESELTTVIGIGASDEKNDVAVYSNYGINIDLLAPGGDTDNLGLLGIDDTGTKGSPNQQALIDNNYAFTNGTSFATPVAAGIVALMLEANPNLTPTQVRQILIDTADKIGTGVNYPNNFNEKRAFGKINASRAVELAKTTK